MSRPFDPQARSFGALLGQYNESRQIEVPEFQRGYSWEKEHVSDFWSDINEFHQEKTQSSSTSKKYFVGPIVVLPANDSLLLLDGQQRLATATILFSVIRDIARSIGTENAMYLARDVQRDLIAKDTENKKYALILGETDKDYFQRTIQKQSPEVIKPTIRSHRLISTARKFLDTTIRQQLVGRSPEKQVEYLDSIKRTIAGDVTMVAIEVGSEDDAYRIFETLNDRGFKLTVPDLVLNFLMRFAKDPHKRREIRERRTEMIELLGQRDIDRFLRHMWLSQFGDVKKEGLFVKIKNHIKDKAIDTLDFASSCASECHDYVAILNNDEDALGKKAIPYVDGIVRRLLAENALPVLLSAHRTLDRPNFLKVAKLTATIIIRHKVLSNLNPNDLETTFYKTAKEIRDLKAAGNAGSSIVKVVKAAYAKINPPDNDILGNAPEVYLTKGEAQYLLRSIENWLHSPTNEHGTAEVNLEHIFPENTPSVEWTNAGDLAGLEWNIGNLTILGEALNNKAANKGYSTKLKNYYSKSASEMTKKLAADYKKWEPADVTKRSREVVQWAVAVWAL